MTTYLGGVTRFTFGKPTPWTRLTIEADALTLRRPFRQPVIYKRGGCHVSCYRRVRWLGLEWRWFVDIRTEVEVLHFVPIRFKAIRQTLEAHHWIRD
jgi:hypothetical protein